MMRCPIFSSSMGLLLLMSLISIRFPASIDNYTVGIGTYSVVGKLLLQPKLQQDLVII